MYGRVVYYRLLMGMNDEISWGLNKGDVDLRAIVCMLVFISLMTPNFSLLNLVNPPIVPL